ncbi:MAG: tetratricopeptide repeat protein [Myxococcota bacterium]
MSLFPHQKLDWNAARLERFLEEHPEDHAARLELATVFLSRAAFHGGGEPVFNKAMAQVRRTLQHEPPDPQALVVAAAILVGLDRLEPARKHAEDAIRIDAHRADAHYVLALVHQSAGNGGADDRLAAVREAETACRLAPDAWEPHAMLATLLWERAIGMGGPQRAPRMLERSQYHTVRALELGPAPAQAASLVFHLAMTCLRETGGARRHGPGADGGTDRLDAAQKLLTRLLDDEVHHDRAQYWLGIVNYQVGRYKNAILFLRQHVERAPDSARVHARIGLAHLQLGEVVKAREACNRALAIDPSDVQARWTLGKALAAEGRDDEAIRTFKSILEDAPDNGPAFVELVALRRQRGDVAWLTAALRAEVKAFDRLPVVARARQPGASPTRGRTDVPRGADLRPAAGADDPAEREDTVFPRASTRDRIAAVVSALCEVDADTAVSATMEAIDLTTDESLRFQLWEAALDHVTSVRGHGLAEKLRQPGRVYSAKAGREVLALARVLPEPLLVDALQIDEEDLRRAAVDRNGPSSDVAAHRRAIDAERREARAWQALLLLAIASQGNRSSRNLLVRWAAEADADLADAARAALVMLGDDEAAQVLARRARARGATNLFEAMLAQVAAPNTRSAVRPLGEGEDCTCSTCQRRSSEVAHMMVGGSAAICNLCLAEVALHRRALETDDPEAVCALSGRMRFETAAMYVFHGVAVSREVVDHGLGLLEREAVDRYLSAV